MPKFEIITIEEAKKEIEKNKRFVVKSKASELKHAITEAWNRS